MNITDLPPKLAKRITVAESGCWLWTAGTAGKGYAYGWWDGAMAYIHRVTYHLTVDDTLTVHGGRGGDVIDHLCANRACVNPAHLERVSQSVNLKRFHAANPDHHQKAWATRRLAAAERAAA